MLKQIWRFKTSVLPGLLISIALLCFAFVLFWVLFASSSSNSLSSIDNHIISLVKFTIFQATLSTILSIIIGLILAWSLAHQPMFWGREMLVALFSSSLVLPSLIVVFGLITVLGNNGWLNHLSISLFDHSLGSWVYGLSGILIAHTYLNASFATRGLLHALESIPIEKYRLSKSLGFSVWHRFWFIEWVAIKPTLLSTASTIFLLCFTSFAIVLMLGGNPSYNTLEVAIYEAVKIDFDIPFALKLSLIQLSISTLLVLSSSNIRTGLSNIKIKSKHGTWKESIFLGITQRSVIAILGTIFVLPLIAIVADGIGADFARIVTRDIFIKSLITSISIAGISAIVTVVISMAIADSRRNFNLPYRIPRNKLTGLLNLLIAFSGNLYLAIPSLILGLGFFLMSQNSDAPMIIWAIIAILTANVLMSLPFALSIITPAMQKTATRYDRLSFSLGLKWWDRYKICELPYLMESIGYIFALSFALSLGDLGVIALFGNSDITTLPWYLYQLMGSYRTADAAGVALILLVLVLGVFTIIPKLISRRSFVKNKQSNI